MGEVIEATSAFPSAANIINEEYRLAKSSAQDAVQHAIKCGALLIEQKKACGHGKFLAWVKANCDFSERTARDYMRVAESPNRQRAADLSIRALTGQERAVKKAKSTPAAKAAMVTVRWPKNASDKQIAQVIVDLYGERYMRAQRIANEITAITRATVLSKPHSKMTLTSAPTRGAQEGAGAAIATPPATSASPKKAKTNTKTAVKHCGGAS